MQISVILATHRRPSTLRAILNSFCELECSGIQWEVLVVDNAGGDEARNVVDHFSTRLPVKLIVETHLGKTNALNTAMNEARGELFLFTDDDVIVDTKWLLASWEGAKRWPHRSVFGGKVVPRFPEDIPLSSLKVDLDHVLTKGCYAIADWEREEDEYHPGMVYGPNWAMRSELFHLGYAFRIDLGPGTELTVGDETELCYRLYRVGFVPVYLPESVVYHEVRKEQLAVQWVHERVHDNGRQWALNEGLPDFPLLFGVPRFMYKTVPIYLMNYLRSYFQRDQRAHFHWGVRYWFERGMFYQYWKGLLAEQTSDSVHSAQKITKTLPR